MKKFAVYTVSADGEVQSEPVPQVVLNVLNQLEQDDLLEEWDSLQSVPSYVERFVSCDMVEGEVQQ